MAKVTERYFYTTDTPYDWSSGPLTHNEWWDEENGRFVPITNIDEARECARRFSSGKQGCRGYVATTYGVEFVEEF